MVGGVETGTFKYNPDRRINFTQGFLRAFGTAGERGLTKGLAPLELHATIVTPVSINRHSSPQAHNMRPAIHDYSAPNHAWQE